VNTDGDGCTDGKEIASVNGDTAANSLDLVLLAQAFGYLTSGRYVPGYDVNRDRAINSLDLLVVAREFGPCS
jgi:hypothetical protein